MRTHLYLLLVLMLVSGIANGNANGINSDLLSRIETDPQTDRYEILFMGNSHSSANGLPDLLSRLIEAGLPGATASSDLAPGWNFLVDRLDDDVSLDKLNSRPWTHVILQAQKYSSSGQFFYPTTAAEEWIRRIKARDALPIMFPEWPRRGNTEEGPRVHQLHLDIASREAACVAPIGLAWEASLLVDPDIVLHAADGNHSNLNGALLTAYVLYEVITARLASELPDITGLGVNGDIQSALREVASLVVGQNEAVCSGSRFNVNPGHLDFNVSSNVTLSQKTLTLTSTGILELRIESIEGPAAPFGLAGGSCPVFPASLAPSESCTIEVDFLPEIDGLFVDSIEIQTNGAANTVAVDLSGFRGPIVPSLNRWGMMGMVLLLAGSAWILKG